MKRASMLVAALFLAGCATFRNAAPDTNPAIVCGGGLGEPDALGRYQAYVCFSHVDGQSTKPLLAVALFSDYPREVRLTPGSHTFTVRYVAGHGFASGDAWIDTFPGRTYLISPENTNGSIRLTIRSTATPAP